jgi:hypothetical protein
MSVSQSFVYLGSQSHLINLLPRGGFGSQLANHSDALGVLDSLPVLLGPVSKKPRQPFLPLYLSFVPVANSPVDNSFSLHFWKPPRRG